MAAVELHSENQKFLNLYQASEGELFRYILSLVPRHADALDILQETATDLWRHFDRYDKSRPFESWARRFAHVCVMRYFQQSKRRGRDMVLLGGDVLQVLTEETEKHEGVLEVRKRALVICIEKLTESERQLVNCRYWSDSKLRDLAGQLGEPEQRLYHRLAGIRKALQRCINKTVPSLEGI